MNQIGSVQRRSVGAGRSVPAKASLHRLAAVLADGLVDPTRAVDQLRQLPDSDVQPFIELSRRHGVEPWIAAVAPKQDVWSSAALQRVKFVATGAKARAELEAFGSVADELAVPWCAVKGQAVAESLYPSPAWRFGVDIDVLVAPSRFAELTAALEARRWQLIDVNWPLAAATMPGELRFRSPTGGLFDVHWHLMNNPVLRRSFPMPSDVLLKRRRQLPSGLPVLSADDQLVHLAVHAALSGACRLGWLLDVGLAASVVSDWTGVAERAAAARAGLPLALVLSRAHRWLATPAGRSGYRAMGVGVGWQLSAQLIDRLSPLSEYPDQPALARSFARSTRPSVSRSMVEFARHASAFVRSGAPQTRVSSPLQDPNDVRSPLHPVPDDHARRRYQAEVATAESG
ncbi:MAG: nucleotidyltransferase family protein [Frankiales bacterium]|nr:nucleotidyltransferase family protein [Frankiales bacterium]